ncbi:hypothetical protein BBP40_003343 [Aspergillus hancockii]|nr:hypothetical protein BBP40_003343 [Aspergillus hancockii]
MTTLPPRLGVTAQAKYHDDHPMRAGDWPWRCQIHRLGATGKGMSQGPGILQNLVWVLIPRVRAVRRALLKALQAALDIMQ